MIELEVDGSLFAQKSGVVNDVEAVELFENGLGVAKTPPKEDDACVLGVDSRNCGAA